MIGLSIDTSSPTGSISILKISQNNAIDIIRSSEHSRSSGKGSHAEAMTGLLQECLQQESLEIDQLRFILVGVGPGSFTGVRVGVNIARSLGYSLKIPVMPVGSLELMAAEVIGNQPRVICALNAFRNLIYTAAFEQTKDGYQCLWGPSCLSVDELSAKLSQDFTLVGDATEFFPELNSDSIQSISLYPHSNQALAYLEVHKLDEHTDYSWKNVKPLYVRDSEPEEKLRTGELKPTFYRKL